MAVATTTRARHPVFHGMVRTIRDQQLIEPGQHLLVAVSGGPDSVALLSLLTALAPGWRLTLTVVHFNYGLRGTESDTDEAFVAALCRERGIALVVQRPVLTKPRRAASLQARARAARYRAMTELADDIRADRIVTGHTANDQAETVLLWLLRGAGLTGLSGMRFIRNQRIVRPLLKMTRQDVLDYLRREGLRYREDSSNATSLYRRNRIRRELLPVMEQITPAIVRLLARQSHVLRADDEYLEEIVDHLYRSTVIVEPSGNQRFERQALTRLPAALQHRLVRRCLRAGDPEGRAPSLRTVESVLRLLAGKAKGMLSVRGLHVFTEREWVVFRHTSQQTISGISKQSFSAVAVPGSLPATVYWPGTRQQIHVQVMTKQAAEPWLKQATPDCAVFDADRLSAPLTIRAWQAGDRMHPRGMRGRSKKLQDLFTDMKVSREARSRIPLLVAPEGIVWVIGRRQDDRCAVGKDTRRCVVVTVQSKAGSEGAG
ncbi:MAG TPA: tRNA lysidine(34) synthetase TilS [Nitrospira sp.]|nr:tRNA lysidine(34) synthetase TilS [Nitrospira sp.]